MKKRAGWLFGRTRPKEGRTNMIVRALTGNIRKTDKYLYCTEFRTYLVRRYRIRYSSTSYCCTVYRTRAEAEQAKKQHQDRGWVEEYETYEHETLKHRYMRKGARQ